MDVILILAVYCERLSVDEDGSIAVGTTVDHAFSIDGVIAAILAEVQRRGFAVTLYVGSF